MSTAEDELTISFIPPAGWERIDVDPDRRDAQLFKVLNPMRNTVANWHEVYPKVRQGLSNAYEQAWNSGVRLAYTTNPDPRGVDNLMATFMVSIMPSASAFGEIDEELELISETLLEEQEALTDDEVMDLIPVDVPELGRGIQAAAVASARSLTGDGPADTKLVHFRTFIPTAGQVLVTTGVSPQTDVAETLFELFALITSSVRVTSK